MKLNQRAHKKGRPHTMTEDRTRQYKWSSGNIMITLN